MKGFLLSWGMVFLSALFDSYAAYIVKTQFNKLGKLDFSSWKGFYDYMIVFFKNPIMLTALATFIAAPAMWFVALNKLDLSVAYPVLVGFHLLFVLFFGVLFLDEGMTANKAIGSLLVLVSLYFFNR